MRQSVQVFLAVALMVAVVAEPAAALDVDEIHIVQLKDFWDNTPLALPYGIEVWIAGTGITGGSVKDPYGVDHALNDEGDGEWGFEELNYASLAALEASYGPGDYLFSFTGSADSVTIDYQYTEPTGFANITNPTDGETGVALDPLYTWDPVVGYGDALGMWVIEDPAGLSQDIHEQEPADISLTSWQPGALAASTEYEFEISVFTAQGDAPPPQEMSTVGADAFAYWGMFEYINMLGFETVPEPATLSLLLLGGLALLRRRRLG